MDTKAPDHRVLLGNEAISRGLAEAGCQFIAAYPGTPSSEILPALVQFKTELGVDLYAEWSTNEKVALETALAAAYSGKRAAVAMKQVGLNVAADPALSSAYIGVVGGLVLIVADDPGLHSSQTEQDSRLFALFSKIPALDPSMPQEAKEMVAQAFELSERYQIPVLLRPTVRVCHSEQLIECKPVIAPFRTADFEKNPRRWAATPRARMQLHQQLVEKLAAIEKEFETWPGNHASFPGVESLQRAPLGIVAAGVCYAYLNDLLHSLDLANRLPVLKIATAYPLPRALVEDYSPVVEHILRSDNCNARHIERTLDGLLDFCGYGPMLLLYRRLCRHYWNIDPVATVCYIQFYRDMWDSDSGNLPAAPQSAPLHLNVPRDPSRHHHLP